VAKQIALEVIQTGFRNRGPIDADPVELLLRCGVHRADHKRFLLQEQSDSGDETL
jgi:hypothetical protein